MSPQPYLNVEIPRVGRDMDSPRGIAGDAYEAASEVYQSVMVALAKLIGFLVMMAAGSTLMVIMGYVLGGYVGACITVAIVTTILIVVFRPDKAVARRCQLARRPGRGTPDRDFIDTRRLGIQKAEVGSIQNGSRPG